jgi:hypothetical protein
VCIYIVVFVEQQINTTARLLEIREPTQKEREMEANAASLFYGLWLSGAGRAVAASPRYQFQGGRMGSYMAGCPQTCGWVHVWQDAHMRKGSSVVTVEDSGLQRWLGPPTWGEMVLVEAFFDPVCSASHDAWPPLKKAVEHYHANVSVVVHLFPLPWVLSNSILPRCLWLHVLLWYFCFKFYSHVWLLFFAKVWLLVHEDTLKSSKKVRFLL